MPDTGLTVIDATERSRFELLLAGERVGLADYSIVGDVVTVPHVETNPEHRGNGFAARLMDGVVDSIRTKGQRLQPICSYAAQYVRERPETHDLVAH